MNTATLRDDEFNQFRNWLHRTSGINLSDAKKYWLPDVYPND